MNAKGIRDIKFIFICLEGQFEMVDCRKAMQGDMGYVYCPQVPTVDEMIQLLEQRRGVTFRSGVFDKKTVINFLHITHKQPSAMTIGQRRHQLGEIGFDEDTVQFIHRTGPTAVYESQWLSEAF